VAKVLSCPDCGQKHKLDLLVGLDFFMCNNCGKKLAVPLEVSKLVENVKEEKVLAVVASATLSENQHIASEQIAYKLDSNHSKLSKRNNDEVPVSKEEIPDEASVNKSVKPKHEHLYLPHGHFAQIGFSFFIKTIIWVLSIGAGFFTIVILPRLFGYGFHAIDFVDVITQNGILKYRVVVYLVTLWSLATATYVGLINYLVTKFKRSR
jgi:hypothetical protein